MDNYLPSVSAAIGDLPQRHIWRFVIALHTVPRIQIAVVYLTYFVSNTAKWAANLVLTNCILNLVEILSLFGLTFVASTDNYSMYYCFQPWALKITKKICFLYVLQHFTRHFLSAFYLPPQCTWPFPSICLAGIESPLHSNKKSGLIITRRDCSSQLCWLSWDPCTSLLDTTATVNL